ncbi:hypothetical protein ACMTN4_00020 (plasmid) [Rhodococcus globerulus]|uniref:hypothetical protein n=1 Tax=Rhodococcus globerulus TaxID=33008 RepID=UPI0039E80D29
MRFDGYCGATRKMLEHIDEHLSQRLGERGRVFTGGDRYGVIPGEHGKEIRELVRFLRVRARQQGLFHQGGHTKE